MMGTTSPAGTARPTFAVTADFIDTAPIAFQVTLNSRTNPIFDFFNPVIKNNSGVAWQ